MKAPARALLTTLAVIAACHSTAPCKPNTILLSVELGAAADQAARVSVRVTGPGDELLSSGEVDRPAGQRHGTIEVRFAHGYPANQTVSINVQARRGDQPLASGAMTTQLVPGCAALSLSLDASDAGSDAPDGGAPDRPDADQPDAGADAGADGEADPAAPDGASADAGASDAEGDAADGAWRADTSVAADAPTAMPARRVFVTSSRHTGNLGGLAGADAICQALADAAALGGSYKAWLSTSLTGPASTMIHSTVPYLLVTGQRVADSWSDLVDGSLRHAIDRDERGQEIRPQPFVCQGGEVWSNTSVAGSPLDLDDCVGWSSTATTSNTGALDRGDRRWTEGECSNITCLSDLPFYCFEQ